MKSKSLSCSKILPEPAGLFGLVVFLLSLLNGKNLIKDADTLWHVKIGMIMLESKRLLEKDIFSHTAFDTPWIAHEWLAEIIMALMHKMAGLEAVICFYLLIYSLTFWLLYKVTERKAGHLSTIIVVGLALTFSASHLAARPHLFTWFFMTLTLFLLFDEKKTSLYYLPFVMFIWTNLHGGFVLGLALQFIFIVGSLFSALGNRRDLAKSVKLQTIVFIISLLIIGLNPFGYKLLIFPFQVTADVFINLIQEWKPPDLRNMWYLRYFLLFFIILVSLPRSVINWTERLLIVFFINAALVHLRHVSLMFMAIAPITARLINDQFTKTSLVNFGNKRDTGLNLSKTSGPVVTASLAAVLLVSGSYNPDYIKLLKPTHFFDVNREHLESLTEYFEKYKPVGNLYNEYNLGGYLLYSVDNPPKIFIDGRADMYGEKILSDYNTIRTSREKRQTLLEEYDIQTIAFDKNTQFIRDLRSSDAWKNIYENGYYVILEKRNI